MAKSASPQKNKGDEVTRLERVLEVIDEAGFESVDSMVTAYYTSDFPLGSSVRSAQALSKKRHLRRLLAALHESSKGWEAQELQNYREGVMQSAEDILADEMQSLNLDSIKGAWDDDILGKLESAISSDSCEALRENKKVFKQQVSLSPRHVIPTEVCLLKTPCKQTIETWSLLMELGNAMDIQPALNAKIVSAFLSILAVN